MPNEAAVLRTLETYAEFYCSKNVDGLMSLFAAGEDISLIGTGADELCKGRSEIEGLFRRNFGEASATEFQWHWRHVTIKGNCATVAVALSIHLDAEEGPISVPLRWTVTLVQESGNWRWLHRHASLTASSQAEGKAYPAAQARN